MVCEFCGNKGRVMKKVGETSYISMLCLACNRSTPRSRDRAITVFGEENVKKFEELVGARIPERRRGRKRR